MFTKGTKIEITTKEHFYTHMGYVDRNCVIPEKKEIMVVKSARQTKNGLKVHFRDETNCGYAIDVERTTMHTLKKID
jgi:hypothetical protein